MPDDDNWLLNVELYSEEFRADLISSYIDEMKLPSTPAMRKCVKEYRKFFNAKDRRKKLATIIDKKAITTPTGLHLGVMSAICNLTDTHPNGIVRSVLSGGLNTNDNAIYADFINFGADKAFIAMIGQATGYHEEELDIGRLATNILLTATTRTMRSEFLAGLDVFISIPHQSYCYDFISDWLHNDENHILYEIARTVEDETRLAKRFEKLAVTDLADTECFPCVNECILIKLMTDINNHLTAKLMHII